MTSEDLHFKILVGEEWQTIEMVNTNSTLKKGKSKMPMKNRPFEDFSAIESHLFLAGEVKWSCMKFKNSKTNSWDRLNMAPL